MSIQFKALERSQPGVTGGGVKKFYASPVRGPELSLDGLTKAIERKCTVNGADIRAVLYAMVEESAAALEDGRTIRLGDLGSLRITMNSEGRSVPENVTAQCVKKVGVIFTPGAKLQEMFKTVKLTKV